MINRDVVRILEALEVMSESPTATDNHSNTFDSILSRSDILLNKNRVKNR